MCDTEGRVDDTTCQHGEKQMEREIPKASGYHDIAEHINPYKPVEVYRNLANQCYNVQQDGKVRCHVDSIHLFDCRFMVSEHAFVVGRLSVSTGRKEKLPWKLSYNPYKCRKFVSTLDGRDVERDSALVVILEADGATCNAPTLTPYENK